jgi:hypothetical protein
VNSVHAQKTHLARMNNLIDQYWVEDPAPLHIFYRKHFNMVDLIDNYWYKVADHHHNIRWRSKLLFGILRLGMVNCWALWLSLEYQQWRRFRLATALKLREFFF